MVLYAGYLCRDGLLVDGIVFNEKNYKPALLVARDFEHNRTPVSADPEYKTYKNYISANLRPQDIDDMVATYHRDRDLCIMGLAAAWGIQVIQAYIQAEFEHSYTMDTNLSLKIAPAVINQRQLYADNYESPLAPGIKLTFVMR